MATSKDEMQRYLLFWHRKGQMPPPFAHGFAKFLLPLWSPKTIFKLIGVVPYVERPVAPFVVHRWPELALATLPAPPSVLPDDAWTAPKAENRKLNHIAVVAGGTAFKNGAVLDEEGRYIWGGSHKHNARIRAARRSAGVYCIPHCWKPPIKEIAGQVIVATTTNSSLYYHWLIDVLPRILQARRLGYDQAKIYVEAATPFQRQSLDLTGIPQHLIVNADQYPVIEADELVVPCHSFFAGAEVPQWLVEFIRTTFKADTTPADGPKRLYVSRADAKTRGVVNEAEVKTLLSDYGFDTVQLANLSFVEQIRLFSSAEVVVGPHGGGLTNLLFCRPETKVLELFPAFNKSDCYWLLASALKLKYSYLKNPEEQVGGRGDANFRVNLDHLRLALENMVSGSGVPPTRQDARDNTNKAQHI